jgi:hypothetical protein
MASSNEESTKTKNPDKNKKWDNLLAKRFIGSEQNIW